MVCLLDVYANAKILIFQQITTKRLEVGTVTSNLSDSKDNANVVFVMSYVCLIFSI